MTALSASVRRPRLGSATSAAPVNATYIGYPVAASTTIYSGALVALNSSGQVVNASADITQKVLGVWVGQANGPSTFVNSSLSATVPANGDGIYPSQGVFLFANGDTITATSIGSPAYVLDNNTVTKSSSSGTRPLAGTIVDVTSDGVWVQVGNVAPQTAPVYAALEYVVAADANASSSTTETVIAKLPIAGIVQSITISPTGAVTANDTNYATLTVSKRDGAGGGASSVASVTTKITGGTGNWTAFTDVPMGTLTGATCANGTIFTFTEAKSTPTGVSLPSYVITIKYLPIPA